MNRLILGTLAVAIPALALGGMAAGSQLAPPGNSVQAALILTADERPLAHSADIVNVLDYGADPTGVRDSTAAFTAALAAVQSRMKGATDYFGPDFPLLRVPAGRYLTGTIRLPPRYTLRGDGKGQTYLIGRHRDIGAVVELEQNAPGEPKPWTQNDHAAVEDMTILAQGADYGISMPDASYQIGAHYGIGGNIRRVNVAGAAKANIYIGANRNFGTLEEINARYSLGDGITYKAYDWRMSIGDVGSNKGWGINLASGGSLDIFGFNVYSNTIGGVSKSQYVNSYVTLLGGSIDDNLGPGLHLVAAAKGIGENDIFKLNGTQIGNNSLAEKGKYPQIFTNVQRLVLNGVGFGSTATAPSYVVENTGGVVYWAGSTVDTADGKPFQNSIFSDPAHVVGAYAVSPPGSSEATVSSPTIFTSSVTFKGSVVEGGTVYEQPHSGSSYTAGSATTTLILDPPAAIAGTVAVTLPPGGTEGTLFSIVCGQGITRLAIVANTGQTIRPGRAPGNTIAESCAGGQGHQFVYHANGAIWFQRY